MPTWPATLPHPLIDGYSLQILDNCERTPVEAAHARVRKMLAGDKDFLTVNWMMTNEQFSAFRDWYRDEVSDGAEWFDTQMDYDGQGLKAVEARFASKWTVRHERPFRWRVAAKLEIKYQALTALEEENILLGVMEKDVVLLWSPTAQDEVTLSKIGPDPVYAYTGTQYNKNGVSLGVVPALHSKGVWVGPGYANLFTAGAPSAQTKTLTAQKYTVWCAAGSVVCGAYGTATSAAPLTFTATAGSCTFTPSDVTRWMLTASVAPMPYVAPGVTVASAAGSTTNGLAWPMSAEMTAALSGRCTVAALVTMGAGSGDLLGSGGTSRNVVTVADNAGRTLLFLGNSTTEANSHIARGQDGTTNADRRSAWSRNEQHIKVVQTNAAASQFRVGNLRVGIDSAIQWGSWVTYDGSFNPLTYLRAAYGGTMPLWLSKVMVSKTGGLTDAQILERLNA